jgi:hypothetical protein
VRVLGWALVLPLMKRLVPVRSLARVVHRAPTRQFRDPILEDQIITFARWGARLVRWAAGGNCLERGLIAYRYLGAAAADPTLVVGLEREGGGALTGHAWVVVDGRPAGEAPGSLDRYTPVFAFGPDGALMPLPGPATIDGGRRAASRIRPA